MPLRIQGCDRSAAAGGLAAGSLTKHALRKSSSSAEIGPLLLFLPPLAQPREEEDDDDGEMPGIGGSESCTIRNSAAIGGRCA